MKDTFSKDKALEILNTTKATIESCGLPDEIISEIPQLESAVSTHNVKVILIGKFSAGKTAFLNALIGRQLFQENLCAETAVPTELYYLPSEHIEIVARNGERQYVALETLHLFDSDDCDHIEVFLDAPILKALDGWVIVDMPGLDSTVEAHHNSILQYANADALCLVTVACNEGEVDVHTLQFIKELQDYKKNTVLMVTKSDLNPDGAEHVADKAKRTLEEMTGVPCPTTISSAVADSTEEIGTKLTTLLSAVDRAEMLKGYFASRFIPFADRCLENLDEMKKGLSLNEVSLQHNVEQAENSIRDAESNLRKARNRAKTRFESVYKNKVLNSVEQALTSNSARIAQTIQSSPDSVSSLINRILRPVLMREINELAVETGADFEATGAVYEGDISQFDTQHEDNSVVDDIAGKALDGTLVLQDAVQTYDPQYKLPSPVISEDPSMPLPEGTGTTILTGVMSALAITANSVFHWLEAIIVMIPGILKLFTAGSAKSGEDQVARKVQNEVIPAIMSQIESQLETEYFPQLLNTIVKHVETEENRKVEDQKRVLKQVLAEKQNQTDDFHTREKQIDDAIETITALERSLENE